ncbi:sugar ABC transporter ATP-binding protein [Kushneria phosphatilytica]|uniref:Sugar ABC transporter ATP-binding protein n=1 Tax=Kushneria phosphatilytica TaxID=657387 RepID=A0A5C1A5T2_9GAMM|nr:sugar ABC transporter ATP-binding protein [Kushneria phosphatilytica]QEL12489.1 sugar ABC transporter ATP-binding protein [Kushneria phosphatilytica]
MQTSASTRQTPSGTAPDEAALSLEAVGITRRFGGTTALDGADFSCRRGEIHVLLGANGAGKSTLVKILCGVQLPDEGELRVEGRTVRLHNPLEAASAGIAAVFQELSLCPHLSVAENIMLAHEPVGRLGQIRSRALNERVRALFERLDIRHIPPTRLVTRLPLADRQLVEIVKALSHDPRILIVDEGTSALGHEEVRRLFALLNRLRDEGRSILFISHRMAEVRELADRLTVFRNGRNVGTVEAREMDEGRLIEMMLGERIEQSFPPRAELAADAPTVLQVEGLGAGEILRDVSFSARAGEVLGIAGLEGQGQGDLLLALFGMLRRMTGQVRVHGRSVRLGTPWRATRAGFALIPEDRKTEGLLQPLSLRENIVMASLGGLTRLGWVERRRERATAERGMQRMEIRAASMELPVHALSGGNQQKVVIAKWLEAGGDIFLFYDPTRGVDVGTKRAFYALIEELAGAGKTVLLYTTELSELVGLCHRVLVMNDHRITCELEGEAISENAILAASLGGQDAETGDESSRQEERP